MGRTVAKTVTRTAAFGGIAVALTVVGILLSGCPTSGLLNEVKNRTEGAYTQLASLSVPSVTLSPNFSAAVTSYTGTVAYSVTSLTVVPMSYKSDATIIVNGTAVVSGATSAAIPLSVGVNTITVEVSYTSSATTTYTMKITRLSQVDLLSIAVSGSKSPTISPPFRSFVTSYTLAAAFTETAVTITPTAADPLAQVVVNPSGPVSISSLAVGATLPVTITVTAAAGGSSRVYTVTVSRQQLGFALDTSWGSSGRVGPDLTGDSRLNAPTSIAVGGGEVYIHDSRNFRVQVFSTSGAPARRWGSYGSGSGLFSDTQGGGNAFCSGYVYDLNGGTIQKFQASSGAFLLQFGSGFYGARIACDPSGNVYVADASNSRVVKFDSNGNQIGSPWSTALQPSCITADSSNVYVGEYNEIQKFTTTGSPVATWTTAIGSPCGMALIGTTLYVATWSDIWSSGTSSWTPTHNGSGLPNITDLATDGTYLYAISGSDYRCYKYSNANPVVLQASWGSDLTTAPGMKSPQRAVVDSSGNLYVSDTGNTRVLKFGPTGTYLSSLSAAANSSLYGLAVDGTYLYAADSNNQSGHNRIAKFDKSSGAVQTDFVGSLASPMDVAIDGNGTIYVANTGAGTVLRYNSGGTLQGTTSGFNGPRAIAADGANNIYVADSGNYCIKKYLVNMGGSPLTWGSNGYNNGQFYSINDVSAGTAGVFVSQSDWQMQQFDTSGTYLSRVPSGQWSAYGPQQVVGSTLDSSGNLYIVDSTDCSVRRYKPQ
jgi:sugar lactone lactonase YvrE